MGVGGCLEGRVSGSWRVLGWVEHRGGVGCMPAVCVWEWCLSVVEHVRVCLIACEMGVGNRRRRSDSIISSNLLSLIFCHSPHTYHSITCTTPQA